MSSVAKAQTCVQIIAGQITPPLEGVTIQIFGKDKESPIQTLITEKDGVYSVGPLDGKIQYRCVSGNFLCYKSL